MPIHDPDIREAIDELAQRLEQVERRLGIVQVPRHRAPVAAPPVAITLPEPSIQLHDSPPPLPLAARAHIVEPPTQSPPPYVIESRPLVESENRRRAAAAILQTQPETPPQRPRSVKQLSDAWNLEKLIGARGFAAAGAIVVVIGVILALKMGYDAGWFRFSPTARCLSAAGFGAALLVAGLYLRRTIDALASAGVTAAGLGTLYGAAYAAFGLYHLIKAPEAFVLLVGVALLGIGLSVFSGLALVAGVSLVGGYLAPLLAGSGESGALVLPIYLCILLAIGLFLSWRFTTKNHNFRHIRTLTWWGTVALGSLWTFRMGQSAPITALAFFAAVWTLVQGELIASARKIDGPLAGTTPDDEAIPAAVQAARRAQGFLNSPLDQLAGAEWRPLITSFNSSAWCAGMAAFAMHRAYPELNWIPPAAATVATLALGVTLAGHLRALVDPPNTNSERLGASLWLQSAGLLIASIALALSGWAQFAAWLGVGIAAMGTARWIRSNKMEAYAVVVLGIATLRAALFGVMGRGAVVFSLGGAGVDELSLALAITALFWFVAGRVLLIGRDSRPLLGGAAAVGLGLFLLDIALLHWNGNRPSIVGAYAILGLSIATIAAHFAEKRLHLNWLGLFNLVLATILVIGCESQAGWTVLMAITGAAWLAAARMILVRSDAIMQTLAIAAAAVAVVLFDACVTPWRSGETTPTIAWVWLGIAAGAMALNLLEPRLMLERIGLVNLVVATIGWVAAYLGHGWARPDTAPLMHPGLFHALCLCIAFGVSSRFALSPRKGSESWQAMRLVSWCAAGFLLWTSTSLEMARSANVLVADQTARGAVLSIYWGLFAIGLLAVGFIRRRPPVRYVGLGLMSVAALKVVFVDLSQVSQGWRIVSFVGLGLLMLAVAAAYAKLASRIDAPTKTNPPEPLA